MESRQGVLIPHAIRHRPRLSPSQWFEFRLGSFAGALRFESDAPALGSAEVVDEDAPQTPLAHDVRPRPHGRVEAVEHAEQLASRPSVVCEQEADLVGLHRWWPP